MSDSTQRDSPDGSTTIYCMHCGTGALESDYACNRCGERVYLPDSSRVPPLGFTSCTLCAAANEAHASFCAVCAAEIDQNARISPVGNESNTNQRRDQSDSDGKQRSSTRRSRGYRIGGGTFNPSQWGLPKGKRPESSDDEVPQEIRRWNWAAFILGPIWGMMHGLWWSILGILPFLPLPYTVRSMGFVVLLAVMVTLGMKGNELAWRTRRWDSAEKFLRTQQRWTTGSIIFAIGAFVAVILYLLGQG